MSFSSRLALAAATVTAAAATIAAGPPETGFDRPGGIYSNVPAKDAAACAIACAQDRICMSWTFRAAEFVGCSLKAVVPASVPDRLAVSGVADRANDFLSLVSNAPPPAEPAPPASVEVAPAAASLAAASPEPSLPAKTAAAPEIKDAAPELLGSPASLSDAVVEIAPATFKSIHLTRKLQPAPQPILEIAAPQTLQTPARLTAPSVRATIQQRTPDFEIAALILPPEPEPLTAPAILTARLSGVTRIAYLPAPAMAGSTPLFTPIIEIEPAPEPLAAPALLTTRLPSVTRAAYRAPPVLAGPAPSFMPIVSIESPAVLQQAALVAASAAPRALQSPKTGLNDHVVLALPPTASAEQPSPSAQPAAFAAIDPAALTQTSAEAAPEEELLGAP